jgi:pyruvate dehydrogenase E1 component beta subunit
VRNREHPRHAAADKPAAGLFPRATPGCSDGSRATPADAKGLLKSAIRDDDPVLVIENLAIYKEKGLVPDDPEFLTAIGEDNVAREART